MKRPSRVAVSGSRMTLSSEVEIRYSVLHPERPVFDCGEDTLRKVVGLRPVLFVSDTKVGELYGCEWRAYARQHLSLAGEIFLEPGENAKTWHQVERICETAFRIGLPRHGVIVGVGGGIVLDTAGFAASILRRGIDYLRIPTTLVGLVDVSVGIKQGVNAFGKKNGIGSFYPPLASINDYRFVRTLDSRSISCGFAEILKMALLCDKELLRLIEVHGPDLCASCFAEPRQIGIEIAHRAELLMMTELAPNLFEDNLARLVDFGHSFSPAIETLSGFEIPHGHAVAIDMLLSMALSCPKLLPRLTTLYRSLGLPCWDDRLPRLDALLAALDDVRRHRGGALNLVTLREEAKPCFLQDVTRQSLLDALALVRHLALEYSADSSLFAFSESAMQYDRPAL